MNWNEKLPLLSIHPSLATLEDVAKMASDIMDLRHELLRLQDLVGEEDSAIISTLLKKQAVQ